MYITLSEPSDFPARRLPAATSNLRQSVTAAPRGLPTPDAPLLRPLRIASLNINIAATLDMFSISSRGKTSQKEIKMTQH